MQSTRDAHEEEQAAIDAICEQLLAQSAVYVDPMGDASYTTAFWAGEQIRVYPANEAQLQATEQQLGFPLPRFLRALYSRVANGGEHLGPADDFYGAEGGWPDMNQYLEGEARAPTIGQRVSRSGLHLHERIEAALMEHPDRYVLTDEVPDGFIEVAHYDIKVSVHLDRYTGRVYHVTPAGSIPSGEKKELRLYTIEFLVGSLVEWFRRGLDGASVYPRWDGRELMADSVDVSGLEEPELVWRGLYRLNLPPDHDRFWHDHFWRHDHGPFVTSEADCDPDGPDELDGPDEG